MRKTNIHPIILFPYFDDIDVKDVHTVLEGLINEVATGPESTPIS